MWYTNKDQLQTYNGQACVYDAVGNPTSYKGKTLSWVRGRKLATYDNVSFEYDAQGKRISKNTIKYYYNSAGKLLASSDGMEYFYNTVGVMGFVYNGNKYIYRKNLQGDIIEILDSSGNSVVQYVYDAWGQHEVVATSGYETLAQLNPFRYRGYFYDVETGLYFLKTRYYDPEIGRFINIDEVSYLDAEAINGLNLYIYCDDNPIMGYDPDGTWNWKKFWKTAAVVVVAVAAVALTVVTLGTAAPAVTAGIVGGVAAASASIITQGVTEGYENIDWGEVGIQTVSGIAYGATSILMPGVGGMFARAGISSATSLVSGWHKDGLDWGDAFSAVSSFAISLGAQQLVNKGILDKLNRSHCFWKSRWADYVVGDNYSNLLAFDFGVYFSREITVGLTRFSTPIVSNLAMNIISPVAGVVIILFTWWLFCCKLYIKHDKLWFFIVVLCEIVFTLIVCIMMEGIIGPM